MSHPDTSKLSKLTKLWLHFCIFFYFAIWERFPVLVNSEYLIAKRLNPLPDDKIWWKWRKVIQTGRKHCGKRRNCSLRAISPFPTVFSTGLFPRGVKQKSVTVMWRKYHVMMICFLSQLQRWMVMIRSARECVAMIKILGTAIHVISFWKEGIITLKILW